MAIYTPHLRGRICNAIAVVGMLSLSPSVLAQGGPSDTITVTAPRHVGTTPHGAEIELVTVARIVSYRGLDLRTAGGAAELNKRVHAAAHAECLELAKKYPFGNPAALECAKTAVENAQSQVNEAIAAARSH